MKPNRKKAFLTTLAALGLLLVGTLVSAAEAGNRKFYVTKNGMGGSQALTACATGYHMASLWEILQPSTLTYDTALGFVTDDSGSGPPVGVAGWIRTGWQEDVLPTRGLANCHAWTSSAATDLGTYVYLPGIWTLSSSTISPWGAEIDECDRPNLVWCVSNR
jgi:hypothetical protein